MRISTGYGSRPTSGGFETFFWYFMRISAIGLFFLAIIHLFINHVTTDVACTSYQLVAARYANPYWRVSYSRLVSLLLFHPTNCTRRVVLVLLYTPPPRRLLQFLLSLFTIALFFCVSSALN